MEHLGYAKRDLCKHEPSCGPKILLKFTIHIIHVWYIQLHLVDVYCISGKYHTWMLWVMFLFFAVVSMFKKIHPYLRKIPILTIFQRGWFNHRTARRDLALLRHSIQIRLDALRVPWVALVSGEIRNKNAYPPSTETYNPSFFGGVIFTHILMGPFNLHGVQAGRRFFLNGIFPLESLCT